MSASPLDLLQGLWSMFVQFALVIRGSCASGVMLGLTGITLAMVTARREGVKR